MPMTVDAMLRKWKDFESILAPEAVPFFGLFSRFEYALKRANLQSAGNGDAEVPWDAFAKKLGPDFYREVCVSGCAAMLFEHPPMHQVIINGDLGWRAARRPANCQELFGAVRRVRNNLFHGGKFYPKPQPETGRDGVLMRQVLAVLAMALNKDSTVCDQFAQSTE